MPEIGRFCGLFFLSRYKYDVPYVILKFVENGGKCQEKRADEKDCIR